MKDLAQLAREAAYKAYGDGESINGIADAVMQVVLEHRATDAAPRPTCATCVHCRWKPDRSRICAHDSEANPMHWQETTEDFGCINHAPSLADQPNSGGALAGDGSSTT